MKTIKITVSLFLLLGLAGCAASLAKPADPSPSAVKATEIPTQITPVNQVTIETSTSTPAAIGKPVFTTSIGDFAIEAVRSVDEINGVTAGPDEKIVLIILNKPDQVSLDPGNFSLDTFEKALRDRSKGEVHISANDGTYTICSMAGWIPDQPKAFAMGFRLPKTAKSLQLFWPGNEPIDLLLDQS